jgi:hypothetical protein
MGLAAGNDNSMRSQALQQALHDVAFITNNAVEQYVAAPCATARGEKNGRQGGAGREGERENRGRKGRGTQRLRSCARDAAWCRAAGMCARAVHGVISVLLACRRRPKLTRATFKDCVRRFLPAGGYAAAVCDGPGPVCFAVIHARDAEQVTRSCLQPPSRKEIK